VPKKQPKRGRLWLHDGSCVRRRPEYPNHVWSYDFAMTRSRDGRPIRILTLLDEFTRECLAIQVGRRLNSGNVIEQLFESFILRGTPAYLRSDNGAEFTAKSVRSWLSRLGVKTLQVVPGRMVI